MNILLATSECVPFAKTGGLADVLGALPIELARQGHRPIVIMPAYRAALQSGYPIRSTGLSLSIPIGAKTLGGELLMSELPGSDVPVYLVRHDDYFDRDGLYGQGNEDYIDNCERFTFFSRAVLEAISLLHLDIDVVHANDWQTGLVPVYLKSLYVDRPGYQRIVSLLTIHNLAYQGQFWHWDMLLTGLDWKYFNWRQMEFFGKLNLLKSGLVFADALSTVSPRYSEEIQSAPLGCGLEGVLQQRRDVLRGIINGIDTTSWNPATDPHLAARYTAETVEQGKPLGKVALQAELGLPEEPTVPLIGFVGRMVDQKGVDLITAVVQDWVRDQNVQWVFLGTGQAKHEQALTTLAERYPRQVAVKIGFSEPLARRIEAGADMFLMPSQYEPCGLNQLYSLRYGTVPIVRATGGLADTVTDATREALADGTATGFSFREYSPLALGETLARACNLYADPPQWQKVVQTAMRQDWSWARSAAEYVELYKQITLKSN